MESWDLPALTYDKAYCLDFFGGDLQGIRQKIPYLKELGVTALYLNPVFFAPSSHKYDCLDYFHVDPHFGGDQALADLSAALHENGMKLILDISINHTGIAHKWFNRDGDWFAKSIGAYNNPDSLERKYYFIEQDNSYHGWFNVDTMPTLNYTSEELRDIIYRGEDSVLKKWLKPPYSIDGWRFDVADTFARNDRVQLADELWPEICRSIKEVNPNAYILAEHWGDCAQYLQGGVWYSPMNHFGCGRVIRQFLGEPDLFMQKHPAMRNFSGKMNASDVKNRILQHLAKLPYVIWENQFNLFDSHDTSRLHNNLKVNREEYRGAVMFQFMLPGAPSIYYGDEAEIDGYLGSMEGCRYPMPWHRDFKTGERYRLVKTMTKLKAEHPALGRGSMKILYAEGNIFAIARFLGEEAFVCVISTEDTDKTIRLPLGAIGAAKPEGETDIFGRTLEWESAGKYAVRLKAEAHQSYLFPCKIG